MSGAHGRRAFFVRSTVVAFWGAAFLLGSPRRYGVCTVLACSTSGSGRGSWLLQAQSTGCSLCFADASERGVSPRLEEGGGVSACFALALHSLSRLRLLLFEARLSGYCVREGGS